MTTLTRFAATRSACLAIALGGLAAIPASAAEVAAVLGYAAPLTLSTPASGIVTQVAVHPGQSVRRGEVLIRLDDRAMRARVKGIEAETRKLGLTRDEARREYQRARTLYEKTVISAHDLKLAEIAAASAEADLTIAQSRLTEARVDLAHATVRAPIDGRITRVMVATGETVQNALRATPMLELADPRQWVARARLSPAQISTLRLDQPLVIRASGVHYTGTLVSLEPSASAPHAPIDSEVVVRFAPNPTAKLLPGGAALIDIPGDGRRE
ncbi:hypothetical protein BI364_02560 [Acidihalobacter yilgarnensis]|uniref:CzcB-like barrel-sandwich hybrid domain-containing protein n=1 Tax=Acidihalobacter yilgarnensis TaxID=2819280 RepID=A0A1D8IKN1_9GAMM|nr:efflux RND transporter periplasmic adaptor subunit [Acidihalobacter yilgarnensis]AOU97033.1 hypothetical protein BI364_02560 [Acidihalobacter yilgarnensis]